MFRTVEYFRFMNVLNGVIMMVICASHLIDPLNGIDIDTPTNETKMILELHNNVYFFIAMLSFMAVPLNKTELEYINRLQIMHYCIMIASNLYLYHYNIMSTWTTPMMNFTLLFMYLLPILPEKAKRERSLTMGCENDENIF